MRLLSGSNCSGAPNVERSSESARFRPQSYFTYDLSRRILISVGSLRVVVEAAGIELQSEKRSKRNRVAPTVAPKMLG